MPKRAALGRPLGLLDLCGLGVNAIVGSSIFLFPGRLAELLGPASILAFGLTGLLLIPVGLCIAEAASRVDRHGGPYQYASSAFGAWTGYAIGWMCWITMIFSFAAVSNGIAVYLGHFSEAWASPAMVKGLAAAVIVALGVLNYRGVKLGAWASNFFSLAKLVPLALLAAAALPRLRGELFTPLAPHGWAPLGPACFMAYFAFQGFETVPVPAGEVDEPKKNVPIAVVGSLLGSAVFYMLIQAAAVGTNPSLAGATRPLAETAALLLGPWGAAFIVLGAAVSMTGFCSGSALGGPRYLVALAQDGHLPSAFSELHPRFGTPHRAVALTTGLVLAAAMALDFKKLVDFSNIVVCAQYISTCAAVPLLRRREKKRGGWLMAFLGLGATVWLGAQGSLDEVGWSLAALVLGLLLRAAWARRR